MSHPYSHRSSFPHCNMQFFYWFGEGKYSVYSFTRGRHSRWTESRTERDGWGMKTITSTLKDREEKMIIHTLIAVSDFKSDFRNLTFLSDPAVNNLQDDNTECTICTRLSLLSCDSQTAMETTNKQNMSSLDIQQICASVSTEAITWWLITHQYSWHSCLHGTM